MREALCNEKHATTHPNQSIENNKSDALKPTLSHPEFLEFDQGEEPYVPSDMVKVIDNKFLYILRAATKTTCSHMKTLSDVIP